MKKFIYGFSLAIILAGIIIACNKESIRNGSKQSTSKIKTVTSDSYLLSVFADKNLTQYQKANILLNEDLLSTTICQKLISESASYDPYIIEVVLASQTQMSDAALIDLIQTSSINDATVKSVLQSKTPLSSIVLNKISSNRPGITLTDVTQYNNYTKLVNICSGAIMYTESLVTSKGTTGTYYLLKNVISVPLANTINTTDGPVMLAGCGGRWSCGYSTSTDMGDGITCVTCITTSEKCVKIAKQKNSLSAPDQEVVDILDDPSLSSFEKSNPILNIENISDDLMNEIIERRTDFNAWAFETILLSSGKISDANLSKLIIDPSIGDGLLKNILIVNTPLSTASKSLVTKFHPAISLSDVGTYSNKAIALSICMNGLLCGDAITVTEISSTKHKTSVTNQTYLSYASPSPADTDIDKMIAGCGGKWVCGDYTMSQTQNTTTNHVCVSPPNTKCVKVAKN